MTVRTAVRVWQVGLNVLLLGIAVYLLGRGVGRALLLLAMVPVAFVPFSYARLGVHARLAELLGGSAWGGPLLLTLALLGSLGDIVMVAQLLTARSPGSLPWLHAPGLTWVGSVWFSTHALWFFGHTLGKLLRRAAVAGHSTWQRIARSDQRSSPAPVSLERREALKQLSFLSVGAPFAVSLSGVPLSYDFRVDEHQIVLPHWPRALDGLRVVHLSDIHVGGEMNRERLLRVAELTNDARPDLVVHTGDFLTHRGGNFDAPLYEALARINPRLGQWACLGNHDYDDPELLARRLRDAGVVTLRNKLARVLVGDTEIEIGGLDFGFDRLRRGAHYERILATWLARAERPRLLLNHDPSGFAALPDGCADLVCSGHTHGGHIGVQLSPTQAITVVGLIGIPDQGLFARGDMQLFVTRCVGFYGYPIRLGIPPEIAVLVLRAPAAGET